MKDKDTLLIEKTYEKGYFKYFAESFTNQYDVTQKKTVDEIIEAPDFKQVGRLTANAFGNTWIVDMTEEACIKNREYYQLLTENPDCVMGVDNKRYPRHDYKEGSILFISDKESNGFVYAPLVDFSNHSSLLREVVINKNTSGKVKMFKTPNTRQLDYTRSGVVIPKHRDMDNSYVSIWGDVTDYVFTDAIEEFAVFLKIETPVYLEYIEGAFETTKFESTGHILLVK